MAAAERRRRLEKQRQAGGYQDAGKLAKTGAQLIRQRNKMASAWRRLAANGNGRFGICWRRRGGNGADGGGKQHQRVTRIAETSSWHGAIIRHRCIHQPAISSGLSAS